MIQIEYVNESNYKDAYLFLSSVPSIKGVENSILKNAVVAYDDDKVIGSISFEEYDSNGLIRYFVFKRNLSNTILIDMLRQLIDNAKKLNINKLICVADNHEIKKLFEELGFYELNKKVYINEDASVINLNSNSCFLCTEI